jgi:GH24 family phage-related lysozyme (muramidase)
MSISKNAHALIVNAEGCDLKPSWPGGKSGVTIGFGYDIGYVTVDQFESDWHERLKPDFFARLKPVVGMIGLKARNRIEDLADISLTRDAAIQVFDTRSLPLFELKTAQAFPGVEALPPDACGALVSLVYNRGTSMTDDSPDDRRREMRAIRAAVPNADLKEIAAQLRSMKRLWAGKGLDGLIARREAEAKLVESAVV